MAGSKGTWRLVGAGALVAALLSTVNPAQAGSTTITDPSGVDYDVACISGDPMVTTTPSADNIPSPGAPQGSLDSPPGDGCKGRSTYDGSTEATDLRSVALSTNGVAHAPSDTQLVATFTLDGTVPAAGCAGCTMDLPDSDVLGAVYRAMFQNVDRHTYAPNNPVGGGCAGGGLLDDVHGALQDGFHSFVGYEVVYDGSKWVHTAFVGTYEPGPEGGYVATELGSNSGAGWVDADANAVFGTHWSATVGSGGSQITITVDGVLGATNAACASQVFNTVYAKAGDRIVSVKGLSTAITVLARPSVRGHAYVPSVGGLEFFSDITSGNSRNSGIVGTSQQPNRSGVSYTSGLIQGSSDTLGRSVYCPPVGPTHNPCHLDDDNVPTTNGNLDPGERGTFLAEWWDTNFGFTA